MAKLTIGSFYETKSDFTESVDDKPIVHEVIKEIIVEKPVEIIKEVIVEKPIEVVKEVEVIKEIEKPIEIIKEIVVEKPVEIVKEVEKIVEVPVEKVIFVDDFKKMQDLNSKKNYYKRLALIFGTMTIILLILHMI